MIGSLVTVLNSVMRNNTAPVYGGTLYLSAEKVNITNSKFVNNTCLLNGGAVSVGKFSDLNV